MSTAAPHPQAPGQTGHPNAAAGRSLLWPALAIAAGSRLALFALAYYWPVDLRKVSPRLLFPEAQVFHGVLGQLLNPWAHWDGVWYIRIASDGYAPFPYSHAFFPLYPLAVRGLGMLLGRNEELAGIVVSLVCFFVLCVLLYRLVARQFTPSVALATVAFLCVFPTSLFFQAVYTESLFLMLVVACFSFSHRGTWPLAGLFGLLAAMTHVSGVVLVVPMAMLYMGERGWSLRRVRADVASLLLVPVGLLLYMAYLQSRFGDALLFRHDEIHWGRRFAWPWETVYRSFEAVYWDLHDVPYQALLKTASEIAADRYEHIYQLHPELGASLTISNIGSLVALGVVVAAIVLGWRHIPLPYTVFMILLVLLPMFGPTRLKPLMSLPRFVLAAFPMFIVFALVTERRPVLRAVLLALFAAGLAYFTIRFAGFRWVA